VALAAVVVGVTVLVGRIAVTNHHVFTDEANAIFFGRGIANDLSVAWRGDSARGVERLTSLMTALIAATTDSASRQLWLLHAVMAPLQALVAVPTWLAGRHLGLSRWAAVAAAAVAAGGSFAFYGIFTLNQSVGLLCVTAMLWAMVRALRRPGLGSDLIVLAALAATALARIGWAPLVVALAPAVLAAIWFERPGGERLGGWFRAVPARLARRHPVLVPVFALGVLAAIAWGPSELLGGAQYGGVRLEPDLELATLWDNSRFLFSHLAIGLALVPFILAVPALIRDLARPADAVSGAYAWLVLGMVVIFSYAYYASMNEDRYLAVLGPPFALAAALAVFGRPPPVWAVVVSGLLSTRLVATSYRWPEEGPFGFFVAPTSRFVERGVDRLAAELPFSASVVATVAVLAAGAAALVVVLVVRTPQPRRRLATAAAAIVLAGVLAFQVAAADHPARKFVEAVGMPQVPVEAPSFIDRAARGGHVEPLAVDDAIDPDLNSQLLSLQVYNHSLGGWGMAVVRGAPPEAPNPRAATVDVDWRDGGTVVEGVPPDVLLQKSGFSAVGFAGAALPTSPYYPFARLQRLRQPLETLWIVRGDSVQGYPERGEPIRLRVFPPAGGRACVVGGVAAHGDADRTSPYRVSGPSQTLRGVADRRAPDRFVAAVPAGRPSTLVLRGGAVRLPDGSWLGPTFVDLHVGDCG
jgi:hypothetical protein